MRISVLLYAVFMRYTRARMINELDYFTGKDIYIKLAGYPSIHLAYSIKDNAFRFVNSNLSPSIFAYDDRARITTNGNKFELVIGGVQACLKKDRIVRCDSSDSKTSSLFKITKNQYGFEIANGDSCITKEMDTKTNMKKCMQTEDQMYDFETSGSLGCKDAEEENDVRMMNIERALGELMREMAWRNNDMHYSDGMRYAPLYDHGPGTVRVDNFGDKLVQQESPLHGYLSDRFIHERPVHDASIFDTRVLHEQPIHTTETMVHETEALPRYVQSEMHVEPVHHAVIHSEERPVVVENRPIIQDQLHSEKTKIIPGKTTVETKTVPVKMRVRTQMAPTTKTVVTETVADQDVVNEEADVSYDEETDVEDVNSL